MSSSRFTAPSLEEMNQLLPAFEFESELSANEIGAVYYTRQKSLDRHVALKLFAPDKSQDADFMASFKRSASLVASLRHANVISFMDSGTVEGMPYLVMEFVPGRSLHRSTHGHVIELKQSVAIIKEVCDGMTYAHDQGVFHGNLSPLNILLNQQASPKIGNFALSRGIHTLPDVEVPTHFTAPEVLAGETPTVAADVYSLGAIFYELITATPYRVGAPLASELEGTPKAVDKVIEKACAADSARRFSSAKEFADELKKAISNKPKPPVTSVAQQNAMMAMAKSTTGTGILVKIVIILALLIAIRQVWNYRQDEIERREIAANGGAEPDNPSAGESFEMDKPVRGTGQQQLVRPQRQPEVVEIPEDPETPMESLGRLQDALAAGTFSELPIGTISKGDRHFFFVDKAMSWDEAVAHANEHGGTLVLPDVDMSWHAQEPIQGRGFWVGAGRSGDAEFTMLNGSAWHPPSSRVGTDPFVCMDEDGNFKTAGANTRLPYVIQWAADGSKPLGFEGRLKSTAASIRAGQAVFPPGTMARGEHRYLPVSRDVTWAEANKLAKSAGGHLMVLSSPKETAELVGWGSKRLPSSSYWLGGSLEGESWKWVSGEPWKAIDWMNIQNAAADNAAMVLRVGRGLDATGKSSGADGFIIEWSKDPETNQEPSGHQTQPLMSPTELTDKAKQLVVKAIQDKEAAHTKNTDKLAWDLNSHLRGLKKSDQERWGPEIEKLNACVEDNRLLKETIDDSRAKLSPFMADLCNYLIRKQGEIDEQHEKSLQAIHAYYLKTLGEISDEAKAAGQVKAQLAADELIRDSQNLDGWVARMSVATD